LEAKGIGKDFLNTIPTAQQLREKVDNRDYTKLKIFCKMKERVSKLKRPPTGVGENICQLHIRQRIDNQNIQGI
jgi:hypothetical protein